MRSFRFIEKEHGRDSLTHHEIEELNVDFDIETEGYYILTVLTKEEWKNLNDRNKEKKTCHDCGVEEGQIHEFGCDMERCPFCGSQLIGCECCYQALGLLNFEMYSIDTMYLPPHICEEGLTSLQQKQWEEYLNKKGRIPYFDFPLICSKCGELWPDFFKVKDKEWRKYIQPDQRKNIICKNCYDFIKNKTDLIRGQDENL